MSDSFVTTWLLCPWDSPGKNTGVGCHFLLQGIFPIQGSNPSLLHWQEDSWPLSPQSNPIAWWGWTVKFPHSAFPGVGGSWASFLFGVWLEKSGLLCFFPLMIYVLPDCFLLARGGEQAFVCLFFVCPRWQFLFCWLLQLQAEIDEARKKPRKHATVSFLRFFQSLYVVFYIMCRAFNWINRRDVK